PFVDCVGSLVGARKATTGLVDLLLRQILYHQQMSNRVACLDQFAVCRNDLRSLDHAAESTGAAVLLSWCDSCRAARLAPSADLLSPPRGSGQLTQGPEDQSPSNHTWRR